MSQPNYDNIKLIKKITFIYWKYYEENLKK